MNLLDATVNQDGLSLPTNQIIACPEVGSHRSHREIIFGIRSEDLI